MPSLKKMWMSVGFLCLILLFSNFSLLLNNMKGVNIEKLPNNETAIKTVPSISDDFESYADTAALGAIWTLGNCLPTTVVTLEKAFGHSSYQSVKLVDDSLTQRANISTIIGPQYGFLYVSAWLYPTEANERIYLQLTNTSNPAVGPIYAISVGFNYNGQYFYGTAGGEILKSSYTASKWYHFEILYSIADRAFTVYVDNLLLCENAPIYREMPFIDRVIIATSGAGGAGSAVFYVDDVTVRDWFIKDQAPITAIVNDNFESYSNNDELEATAWEFEAYADTNVTLQSYAPNSHSYLKSVRFYDNSITNLCGLSYWFPKSESTAYFRSYVRPLQTNGYLYIRIRNSTGYGVSFIMDGGQFKRGTYTSGVIGSGVFFKPNLWYKIELFASNVTKIYSVRVNDSWVFQNVPFDYQFNTIGWTNIALYTAPALGAGQVFYLDDVFVANQSDRILAGMPLNAFNEKLLLDNDTNSQVIQSVDVSGQQTIVVDYRYNFSEYTSSSVKNITWNYGFSTIGGVQIRSIVRLYNYSEGTWNIISNTTTEGVQSLGGCLFEGILDYLNSESILLVHLEVIRLASSSVFDFSLNQLLFRCNLKNVLNILTPENTTYIESTSGYYPATYGFDNVPDGQDDPAWVDTQNTATIVSSWYGHNKVYQCATGVLGLNNYFPAAQASGTVELYMNEQYANEGFQGRLFAKIPADTCVINWRFYGNRFQYNNGTFNSIGKSLLNNVWYHVRIDFETTTGNYLGLAPWTYRIYLDGEAFGPYKFLANYTPIFLSFYCGIQSNRRNIDAVGYSWDPTYRIGDNWRAGVLLTYKSEITLDWKGYSLDGQPIKPLLGIAPIPLNPSGTHTLQIYANDTNGHLYESEVRYFTVDVAPPTYASVLESADPLELGATETITIAGVADHSGINQVLLEFEGTNHTMTDLGGGTWRYNTWVPSSLGAYPYEIYLQDTFGHWNLTSGAIQVVDVTIPTYSSVMESADPLELGATETITILDAADPLSGINQTLLAFEGINHTMTDLGEGTWRYNTWTPASVGTYPYSIFIQDYAGHWNATSGAIQVVDFPSDPTQDEWPMFRGQLNHTGEAHTTPIFSNNPYWSYPMGPVESSPSVVDGCLYVGSNDGKVYCLNATTGQQLWNYTTGNAVKSSPAVAGRRVYIGSNDGKLYCLNITTGQQIWNYTTGSVETNSPAVVGGAVYIGTSTGLYCLNAITGAKIWDNLTGVTTSPAIAYGFIFCGLSAPLYNLICLDAITGAPFWNPVGIGMVSSSPAVYGGLVIFGISANFIISYDLGDSLPLWFQDTGGSVRSSPAVAGLRVYVGCDDNKVYCLRAATGDILWTYTTGADVRSSPAVADQYVYVGSNDGNIYCLNTTTGAYIWSYTTGSSVLSSPAVAEGRVYVGSNDGKVYCLPMILDNAPPIYNSVTESVDPLEFGATENITITGVVDRLSGIQTVQIDFEGTNHTMTDLGGGIWNYAIWTPSTTGEHSYTIYLQDDLGNWNKTSGTIQVIDTTSPTYISILESADPLELGGTETITITGVADLSGIQEALLELWWANYTMNDEGGGIWDYGAWTPADVGTYSYRIFIKDNEDNWNVTSGSIRVVDTMPPTYGGVTESADPLELSGTEIITITGVADLSGIQQILLEVGATNYTMSDSGGGTWVYNTWSPSSTGEYSYKIYLRDKLGNCNMTDGVILVVDAISPAYTAVVESADPIELGSAETITIFGVEDNTRILAVLIEFEGYNHSMSDMGGGTWLYTTLITNNTGDYPYMIYIQDTGRIWMVASGSIQVVHSFPPDTPTLFPIIIDSKNLGVIYLNWDWISEATIYYIFRADAYISGVEGMCPIASLSSQTYFIDVIPLNKTYYYVIMAGNGWVNSSISNSQNVTVQGLPQIPPNPPRLNPIFPIQDSDGIICLDWNDVSGASTYYIYRSNSPISSVIALTPIAVILEDSYFVDLVDSSATYYYVIVAENNWGNSSISNSYSVEVSLSAAEDYFLEISVIVGASAIAAAIVIYSLLRRTKPVAAPPTPPKKLMVEPQSKSIPYQFKFLKIRR